MYLRTVVSTGRGFEESYEKKLGVSRSLEVRKGMRKELVREGKVSNRM
jgi:hypothetical protein